MIQVKNINKLFNEGKPNAVIALNKVNLTIEDEEFITVIGANGSGKTTLLNALAGTLIADSGSVIMNNTDVTKLPDYQRCKWIARIFQNPLLGTAANLSIVDNFRLAALRTQNKGLIIGKNEGFKKQVRDKIAALGMGLENKIEQPIGTLSGGQRQALTLLMSVMDECKILLLDEPTAALDPKSAALIMETAGRLIRENKLTALLVTHNIKDAVNYGSRVIQMEEGRIIKDVAGAEKQNLKQNDLFSWFG